MNTTAVDDQHRPDPHVCACAPGTCSASADGKRIGRVSTISDIRCKATIPATALAGKNVPCTCGCPVGGVCREAISGTWVEGCERRYRATARIEQGAPVTASMLLAAAEAHMGSRASTYDQPTGERSMGRTVAAFNEITGRDLLESEGWLLMELLKAVRDYTTPGGHADSQEDRVAYAALAAEARRAGR